VIDIDMTDYDDVRVCCSGASICERCWPLIAAAVKVVHKALTGVCVCVYVCVHVCVCICMCVPVCLFYV